MRPGRTEGAHCIHQCRTQLKEDSMAEGNRKKAYLILIVILVVLLVLLKI